MWCANTLVHLEYSRTTEETGFLRSGHHFEKMWEKLQSGFQGNPIHAKECYGVEVNSVRLTTESPPSYHSEQIHSLNDTSKPIRVRWDRSLGHSINMKIPKWLNREICSSESEKKLPRGSASFRGNFRSRLKAII